MVDFPVKPAKTVEEERAEEVDQDSKVKSFKDPLDLSFTDSFLDFDSINWLGSNRELDEFKLEDYDFEFFEDGMEMVHDGASEETRLEDQTAVVSESIEEKSERSDDSSERVGVSSESVISDKSRPTEDGSGPVVSGVFETIEYVPAASLTLTVDESELKKTEGDLACSIEVGLEKVSLAVDDDRKSEEAKSETNSSESGSEVSSSSSSSSESSSGSSSEEESEEEEMKKKEVEPEIILIKEDDVAGELEEGEILSVDGEEDDSEIDDDDNVEGEYDDTDAMIAWDDEDEEIPGTQTKEPIRSKNELKELPPVPAVNVTLEPHHTTLPVGVVLSVLGTQVIVEGVEKHNPLKEGSILWITERRTPLGLVDEIFGPVKNPYYIVRFNTESEVPEGIIPGTPVSFVAEFADHVLNDKNLYRKGYDASGENDEEISEELEFSDDEKEAEYRRMQKLAKRGMNEQKSGNTKNNKKKKNRDPGRHMNRYSPQQTGNQPAQQMVVPNMLSSNHSDSQMSSVVAQTGVGMGSLVPHFQPLPQMGGFVTNNMANRTTTPTGFPPNGAVWNPQTNQQNPYQLPTPNQMGMPNPLPMQNQMPLMPMQNQLPTSNQMIFQQQLGAGQMSLPNMVAQGGQGSLNLFAGPNAGPWPGIVGQDFFNQAFGIGLNGHHGGVQGTFQNAARAEPILNPFVSQGFQQQPQPQQQQQPQPQPQPQPHQQQHSQRFGVGASFARGRKPPHRGGGRFGRGRGRHQS